MKEAWPTEIDARGLLPYLAFHRCVICLLGERLTSSTALLRSVIE